MSNTRFATAILLASATSALGQTYIGSIFAGTLVPENVPATSISLDNVAALASDSSGNIFLAVLSYAGVFRVDAKTGILTRVAGNGTSGFMFPGEFSTARRSWRRAPRSGRFTLSPLSGGPITIGVQ